MLVTSEEFTSEFLYDIRHAYGDVGGDTNERGRTDENPCYWREERGGLAGNHVDAMRATYCRRNLSVWPLLSLHL